jgi:hypothetical protein
MILSAARRRQKSAYSPFKTNLKSQVAGAVDFPERGADRVRMQKPPLFYVKAPILSL